jgi:hypothetical protein
VREGLKAGHAFNPGAVYLRPAGVRDGTAFLPERFKDHALKDTGDPNHGIDLKAMAIADAGSCKAEKRLAQKLGLEVRTVPGVHHPVFNVHGLPLGPHDRRRRRDRRSSEPGPQHGRPNARSRLRACDVTARLASTRSEAQWNFRPTN